jgi:hypothetical protein
MHFDLIRWFENIFAKVNVSIYGLALAYEAYLSRHVQLLWHLLTRILLFLSSITSTNFALAWGLRKLRLFPQLFLLVIHSRFVRNLHFLTFYNHILLMFEVTRCSVVVGRVYKIRGMFMFSYHAFFIALGIIAYSYPIFRLDFNRWFSFHDYYFLLIL